MVAEIPKEVQLVYWDYCHNDAAFYRDWIGRHRAMGYEPVMASGVWTWSHLWYNRKLTEANAGACLDACRSEGLKEVVFTMWGDDGAYCDFDSALAGLAWAAESAYAAEKPDEARLRTRFAAVCGADYAAVLKACELNENLSAVVIWDDPILGLFLNEGFPPQDWPALTEIQQRFARLAKDLDEYAGQNAAGDLDHARLLAEVLSRKIELRVRLVAGYDARDHAALTAVGKDALALAESFETLEASWRRGWMRRNKPQGFEVIQLRVAQQAIRHRELARRIDELLTCAVAAIPELDERRREAKGMAAPFGWRSIATSSVSI